VVDVANVMGARADGWWRDRAGAALRLCREVMALAQREDSPAAAWVLVLEGQAREAAAVLAAEGQAGDELAAEALPAPDAPPGADWVPPLGDEEDREDGGSGPVRVVAAPGSGDDAIVGVVAEAVALDQSCLVVTADRELRQRCEDLSASVVGPGWLLRLL
jgi:8-oxo-dGTP diphosphatase